MWMKINILFKKKKKPGLQPDASDLSHPALSVSMLHRPVLSEPTMLSSTPFHQHMKSRISKC